MHGCFVTVVVGLVTFGSFTGNVGESSVVHFVYQQLLNLMMPRGYEDAWAYGRIWPHMSEIGLDFFSNHPLFSNKCI